MSTLRDDTLQKRDDQAVNDLASNFGVRLSTLIRAKGIIQADLARATEEAKSKISAYVNGDRLPQADTAIRIAQYFGVTPAWLIFGEGAADEHTVQAITVPYLDVQFSAGGGRWRDPQAAERAMVFDPEILRYLGRSTSDGLIVVEARGDSMEPDIADGGQVIADTNDTSLREGIFAFRLGDDLRIKRLRPSGIGNIEAISSNPAYPPEIIPHDMREHFEIIGRILLSLKKF